MEDNQLVFLFFTPLALSDSLLLEDLSVFFYLFCEDDFFWLFSFLFFYAFSLSYDLLELDFFF